jgi:hypothetical protein
MRRDVTIRNGVVAVGSDILLAKRNASLWVLPATAESTLQEFEDK